MGICSPAPTPHPSTFPHPSSHNFIPNGTVLFSIQTPLDASPDVFIYDPEYLEKTEKKEKKKKIEPHPISLLFFPTLHIYNLRPRRPPLRRVLSDGVGVTSSIRPIRIPARASARSALWAPGPGVLVPLPIPPLSAKPPHLKLPEMKTTNLQ